LTVCSEPEISAGEEQAKKITIDCLSDSLVLNVFDELLRMVLDIGFLNLEVALLSLQVVILRHFQVNKLIFELLHCGFVLHLPFLLHESRTVCEP